MINQQLLEYIRAQLKAGARKEDIKKILSTGGWTAQDADEAFMAIEGVTVPPVKPPMPVPTPQAMATMAATPAADLPTYTPASFAAKKTMPIIVKKKRRLVMWISIILVLLVLAMGGFIYAATLYPSLAAYLPSPLSQWIAPTSAPADIEQTSQEETTTTVEINASSTEPFATSTASTSAH